MPSRAGDPGAVGAGDLRRERPRDDDPGEARPGRARPSQASVRSNTAPLVLLERVVVADALVDHLVDRAVLAVVVDRDLHPRLPLVVPDRRRPGDHHEGHVLHVRVVEQREGDGQHALALEVVDVLEVHRVDGLVVERVHRAHAPLQRVEDRSVMAKVSHPLVTVPTSRVGPATPPSTSSRGTTHGHAHASQPSLAARHRLKPSSA